jgi:hypothetical protein
MDLSTLLPVFRSIKVIAIAISFFLAIIINKACIPVRMYISPKIFTEEEPIMLDTDDDRDRQCSCLARKNQEDIKNVGNSRV